MPDMKIVNNADLVIRYFITRNRVTPFGALYGYWKRGNFQKACNAGFCLYSRQATPEEIQVYANRQRELGFSYKNLTAMVREVSIVEGPAGRKRFMESLRYHRTVIETCLGVVAKKRDKHELKKLEGKRRKEEAEFWKKEEARGNLPKNVRAQLPLFDAPLKMKKVEENIPLKISKKNKRVSQRSLF